MLCLVFLVKFKAYKASRVTKAVAVDLLSEKH